MKLFTKEKNFTKKKKQTKLPKDALYFLKWMIIATSIQYAADKRVNIAKTTVAKDKEPCHTSEYCQIFNEKILQDDKLKKEHTLSTVADNASDLLSVNELNVVVPM